MHPNLKYWLWLTLAFGAGTPAKWSFLADYDSIVAAYNAAASGDYSHVLPKYKKSVQSATMDAVDRLIDFITEKDISVCCYEDEEYPQRLREIYNPPSALFYRGDISIIDSSVVISCVGTRKPSEYSVEICSRICMDLASAGVVIASGFQVGLDSLAHNSAIRGGGKTIAVVPCGLLYDYPKENAHAKEVVAKHGAIITEYLPGDKPSPLTFRARNRILSGIGLGTLVMQAGKNSGALSTASFALAQGRDIFCISPHELFNDEYSGVVGLIRDGAIPVFDSRDILNEYFSSYSHKLNLKNTPKNLSGIFDEPKSSKRAKKTVEAENTTAETPEAQEPAKPSIDPDTLSDDRRLVYDYLCENGAVSIDTITDDLSDKLDDPESVVTDMEMEGILHSLPGNRFSI